MNVKMRIMRKSMVRPITYSPDSELIMQGWMEIHKNKVMSQWKRRYCVLNADAFIYFKNGINWLNVQDRHTPSSGEIRLGSIDMVTQHVKKANIITLKNEKMKISIKADSSHDQWFNAIRDAVNDYRQRQDRQREFSRVSRQLESRGEAVLSVRQSLMIGSMEHLTEEAELQETGSSEDQSGRWTRQNNIPVGNICKPGEPFFP